MNQPTNMPDIEVTAAMAKAGASVIYRMELELSSEEFWAREIYEAMILAKRPEKEVSS